MTTQERSASRLSGLAAGATLAAVAACYGTTLVLAALASVGVVVALNEGGWAGAISFFALLALVGVMLGHRQHRMAGPAVLAAEGVAAVLWAMFGSYHWLIELGGLVGLALAAVWDWQLKRTQAPAKNCGAAREMTGDTGANERPCIVDGTSTRLSSVTRG